MPHMVTSFYFSLCLILATATAFAQGSGVPEPDKGFQPGNSYAVSNIESINTTNGNLTFDFPLASLPAGRAGLSGGIALSYNSKLWETHEGYSRASCGSNPDCSGTYFRTLNRSEDGGWHYITDYRFDSYSSTNIGHGTNPSNPTCYPTYQITYQRPVIVTPDGAKHELYIVNHVGGAKNNDGGLRYTLDGTPIANVCETAPFSRPAVNSVLSYYTTDGTFLRLDVTVLSGNGNYSWVLHMPGGGRVEGASGSTIQKIYDRNSNYIQTERLSNYNGTGHQAFKMSDQMGREIAVEYGAAANEDWVYSKGFNNASLTTKIKWKTVYVYRSYIYSQNQTGLPFPRNQKVIESITLPSQLGNLQYQFAYNANNTNAATPSAGWGEISSLTLPSGAVAEYEYKLDSDTTDYTADVVTRNHPVTKTLTYAKEGDGQTGSMVEKWIYDFDFGDDVSDKGWSTVTGPDGGVTKEEFDVDPEKNPIGQSFRTTAPDGTITERKWQENAPYGVYSTGLQNQYNKVNPYIKTEWRTVKSGSTPTYTSAKDYTYDKNGNILEIKEYDWVTYGSISRTNGFPTSLPSSGALKRITATAFNNPTPSADSNTDDDDIYHKQTSPNVRNAAAVTEIKDGSSVVASGSEFTYDNPATTANLTATKVWDSNKGGVYRAYSSPLTSTNSISTSTTYDSYGNPTSTTDANSNVAQTSYGSVNGYTNLYPTQIINAYGTSVARTVTNTYDFYSGLPTSTTDVDNSLTNSTEYDILGRPIKVMIADGTPLESWTVTEYNDAARRVIVRSDLDAMGDGKIVVVRHFDPLGRQRLFRRLENAAAEDPTDEQDGIKIQTRYLYDNPENPAFSNGTYVSTSNPYRAASSSAASTESTMGWTLSHRTKTGITTATKTYAGAALPAPWGSNSLITGTTTTQIDSNTTTVTDQAGKLRRSVSDGLGQLIRIDEPNSNNELGSVSSPNQATTYTYTALGDLAKIVQGSQNRYFMYSSLGRVLRVRLPEQEINTSLNTSGNPDNNQWTRAFSHDNNGNLATTKNANGTVITNTYDALNRVTEKSYTDSTPVVTYTYDNKTNAKGQLTKISSAVSSTEFLSFDVRGRVTRSNQVTDGETYGTDLKPITYTYNLGGLLTEQTYPSGRKTKNALDSDGDLSAILSKKNSAAGYGIYADNIKYSSSHKIESLQLGNGLWESAKLNSRDQVTELALGVVPAGSSLWKVNYEYGELQTTGSVDTEKNNWNIAKQTVSFSGQANPYVQTYKYDSLNRLMEAKETVNSSQKWIQNFNYDRYGNRTSLDQYIGAVHTTQSPAFDQYTNRFQSSENVQYDAAGNVTRDPDGTQFLFNGDSKQVEVRNASNAPIGYYYYDGNGKRVKKVTNSETTIFVYDAFGKLLGEYSTVLSSKPAVNYTATDPLGSPRVITDGDGNITSRRDFMPFGEELNAGIGDRTTAAKYGYGDDNVRQRFTGYEKDIETGLDFAEARYYDNNYARFTAVDPLLSSGQAVNPQTFNRYTYVLNQPLKLTDHTGLQAGKIGPPYEYPVYPEPKQVVKGPLNVTVTVAPAKAYVDRKLPNGYFTGVASEITVKFTDSNDKPIVGASVQERNKRVTGSASITEREGPAKTDSNGEITDIVGAGGVEDKPKDFGNIPRDKLEKDMAEVTNETELNRTSQQTLTVTTPDAKSYEVTWQRTISNVKDGKLNQNLNTNGVNVVVTYTEPVVKEKEGKEEKKEQKTKP